MDQIVLEFFGIGKGGVVGSVVVGFVDVVEGGGGEKAIEGRKMKGAIYTNGVKREWLC